MTVIKRNGKSEAFSKKKIYDSIVNANSCVEKDEQLTQKQIKRITSISGTALPKRFERLVDRYGDNPEAMKQAGIAYATDQIIDLFANNVTNVHVYSMNKPEVAARIKENLSEMLG